MSRPKHTAVRTYTAVGRLHRNTNAPAVLHDRRVSAGLLFDAALDELGRNHAGKALNTNQSQLLATTAARNLGMQRGPLNARCRIAVVGNAVMAWNHHVNHDYGMPQLYAGQPVNTIETFAHCDRMGKPLVTFNQNGKPTLRFPGLPPIRLTPVRPLPDDQPTYCSVSVHEKQVRVSLVYRIPQEPLKPAGEWNPHAVLGLDLGVTDLLATSAGISHAGIQQRRLQEKIRRALRIRSAMVRKAMRAGLAGYRPVLDDNNRQVKSDKGNPRRYLHWVNGKPTKQYRKAQRCVSRLLRQRQRQRKSYRHQVAAAIVKHCASRGIELIAVEKLNIPNMVKSAQGTVANPGKRVSQKRGLNRRILQQGWAEVVEYIRYKARYLGIRLVTVHAGGTSQTCSACGRRDAASRTGKEFVCTGCGYRDDADRNAAVNIGDRGIHHYVKSQGVALGDVRRMRLESSALMSSGRQEPATGIGPPHCADPTGYAGFGPDASHIHQPAQRRGNLAADHE